MASLSIGGECRTGTTRSSGIGLARRTAVHPRGRDGRRLLLVLSLVVSAFSLAAPRRTLADEFSLLPDSWIIGRSYGDLPSGDPTASADENARRDEIGTLSLALETAVFFKNLELTGFDDEAINGETFFGFFAPLRLRFRANEKVLLEAGALVGHNFGDTDTLDVAEPILRLVVEPTNDIFIIGGSIVTTHFMLDALRDDVTVFREGVEQGVQFRANRQHWKQDTWINWFERETDIEPEAFEVGSTTQFRVAGFWIDAQVLWSHVGGQINSSDRVEDNLSGAIGGSWGTPIGDVIRDLRLGAHWLSSNDDTRGQPRSSGSGSQIKVSIDLEPREKILVRIAVAHFSGDDFLAERGDPLYRFDDYTRFSAHAIFDLDDGMRVETAVIGQLAGDEFVNTYLVNFVWGGNFPVWKMPAMNDGSPPSDTASSSSP